MKRVLFLLLLAPCILYLGTCASLKKEEHAFGDDCKHCHGDRLQGVKNIKAYCGECHDLKPLKPEEISDPKKKEVVLSDPHIHKTKNMFSSTPSCFNCHRKTDF